MCDRTITPAFCKYMQSLKLTQFAKKIAKNTVKTNRELNNLPTPQTYIRSSAQKNHKSCFLVTTKESLYLVILQTRVD